MPGGICGPWMPKPCLLFCNRLFKSMLKERKAKKKRTEKRKAKKKKEKQRKEKTEKDRKRKKKRGGGNERKGKTRWDEYGLNRAADELV